MTFVDVLWSLFHLLKGMSLRMEHATASSASSDAVELRMQRHCEMMQDGVAELLSFLLPSFVKLFFVDAFSLQFAGLCDSGSLPCQTHEWCSQFGSQRTNALQWIVQLCSDKHSLPLYLFPGLRRERRDKMHCARSEHPYSYMYAECSRNK